jgi:hypothetical protein
MMCFPGLLPPLYSGDRKNNEVQWTGLHAIVTTIYHYYAYVSYLHDGRIRNRQLLHPLGRRFRLNITITVPTLLTAKRLTSNRHMFLDLLVQRCKLWCPSDLDIITTGVCKLVLIASSTWEIELAGIEQ